MSAEQEYPFACCEHCHCGQRGGVWDVRRGHDDTCRFGCNDADVLLEIADGDAS